MFKTIVVGLDGSPRQPAVLERALQLASASNGTLHLGRAMQVPLSIPAVAWSLKGNEFAEFLVEHGTTDLRRIASTLPPDRLHGVTCRIGAPSDVLCDLATEHHADLIVIGSHGYDRIDRFIGTTAARVTNVSPCSVLVVKSAD